MKKQVFVILLLLLNLLIVFIPADIVRGDPDPYGGNIVGNTVYWENSYANLSVYPHTSTNIIRQAQWANLTWKASDNVIDVAFRFDDALSYGKIWKWGGDSWVSVSMGHIEYGGKHYYPYVGFNVVQDTTYRFKWEYDVIANTTGKWWLFAKLNEHTIQQALNNNWYVALDPYWDSSYMNYRKITVESDYIDSDLTNFPLLVVLDNSSGDFDFHNSGADIEFISTDNTTHFNLEIESFDNAGDTVCWVNVSETLTSGSDYSLLVYYNNSADTTVSHNPEDVWDSNYLGVYHLDESAGSDCVDSTSNHNNGTYYGNLPTQIAGKMGYGQDFDGTNDNISLPSGCYLGSGGTVSAWFEADVTNLDIRLYSQASSKAPTPAYHWFAIGHYGLAGHLYGAGYAPTAQWDFSNALSLDTTWHYYAMSMATNDIDFYRNTTVVDTDESATLPAGGYTYIHIGENADGNYDADGTLDEVRVSDIKRNASWLNASFHSMNQTSGFMSFSGEHVETWSNTNPVNSNPDPQNGNASVSLTPTLRIQVNDIDMANQSVNITWLSNSGGSWIEFATNSSSSNTTFYQTFTNGTVHNTLYYWSVNTTDGNGGWDNDTYSFTTLLQLNQKGEAPSNSSTDVSRWTACNVTCTDEQGDSLTVYFYENTTGSWVLQQTNSSHTANTSAVWSNYTNADSYSTTYWWRVSLTDGVDWVNRIYHFTTENGDPIFSNPVPANNSVVDIGTDISIDITDPDGDTFNWSIATTTNISYSSGNDESDGTVTSTITTTPLHNTNYIWYVNCTDGYGWTNRSYNFTAEIQYVAVPVGDASEYITDSNRLNLSWTNHSGASEAYRTDNYIVIQRNDTYATSATQSGNWMRQNLTRAWFNVSWTATSIGFFTIFGYNDTAEIYSYNTSNPEGLNIPWGALALSCFSENNPSLALNFDIEISNSNFTTTYTANNITNVHYIDMEDIPYGEGTIFLVSNSSYETRSYTYDIQQNTFYNLVFYLPLSLPADPDENITYAEDYVIHVVGPATEYGGDPPIEGAEVIIRKYINTTGQYEDIGAYVTSADGTFTVPLLPNNLYSFNISATGYYDEIESWMPVEIVFEGDRHHTFRLAPLAGEDIYDPDYDIFWDFIRFNATLHTNGSLFVNYVDYDTNTTDAQFYIYENYNFSITYITTDSTTSNTFSFWVTGLNNSRTHEITIYLNHTTLGFEIKSIIVLPVDDAEYTEDEIERKISNAIGPFSLGYVQTFLIYLPIVFFLVLPGLKHPGFAIIMASIYAGFASSFIVVGSILMIIPFAIAIGVILMAVKGGMLKL